MTAGDRTRLPARAALGAAPCTLFALLLALPGCEAIILEPDLDAAASDADPTGDGPPAPHLADALPEAPGLDPPALEFGPIPPQSPVAADVVLSARTALTVHAVDVVGAVYALAEVPAPQRIPAGGGATYTVVFTPEIAGRGYPGALRITTDAGLLRVPLAGRGAWAGPACAPWSAMVEPAPPAFVEPGDVLRLTAKTPAAVPPERAGVEWRLAEAPIGVEDAPVEAFADPEDPSLGGPPDDPATPTARFAVRKPGRYVFTATPRLPPEADCAPPPTAITVHACPCETRRLHLRVGWRLDPGVAGRVALLVAPPAAAAWDDPLVARSAPLPDWGFPGPDDDPHLEAQLDPGAGRADFWVEGTVQRGLYRVALVPLGPPGTAIDVDLDLIADGRRLATLHGARLGADAVIWDAVGVAFEQSSAEAIVYDRVLSLGAGRFPPLDLPLAEGAPCHPAAGPRCAMPLRCLPHHDGARCHR